jgi:putative hydrolase of HD superfamily
MGEDIRLLIEEWEASETIEAKVAKDADTLNGAFQCKAYLEQGHNLLEAYLHNFQFRLKTESGKKMYTEILETQSYDWLLPHEKKGYHK